MNRRRFLSCALVPLVPVVPAVANAGVFVGIDGACVTGEVTAVRVEAELLRLWINAVRRHQEAAAIVERYDAIVRSLNGALVQSPYLEIMNRQMGIMRRMADQLGFVFPARMPSLRKK